MGKAARAGQPSDPSFAQGRGARFIDENGGGPGVRLQKSVQLASYDERLLAAARFLGIAEWSESQ
jgi:hypothetical protein